LGSQWCELQACVAEFSRALAAGVGCGGSATLPLWHARLHACFLGLFDFSWRLAVALHPSVLPGAVVGEGGDSWLHYAASPSAGLPPPLSPARQAATQLGALCSAALDLAMACGCAPDAAGGARLLAMAGLRNADAALAAFNALAGGRGEGGALPLSAHRVLLRACARHGGAPEVALPALWALSGSNGVVRCGDELAALISALRGACAGDGDGDGERLSKRLALGLLLEQAVGARAAGGGDGGEGEDSHDEIFATVGHLIGRGGGGGGAGSSPATAAPAVTASSLPPPRSNGSFAGSDADDEFSATSGESSVSGSGSGSGSEDSEAEERGVDSDEDSLLAFGLREVAPGVWLPEALSEGEEGGDEEGENAGDGGASPAFLERSVRESQWWRAAAAHLAATGPPGGYSPEQFQLALTRLRELRESDGGGEGSPPPPPPWVLSARAHGAVWAPRLSARVEAVVEGAALLLGGGGAAAAAAAVDPRVAAAAELCRAHPEVRPLLLAGVRARTAAGLAAALQRADLSADFLLLRQGTQGEHSPGEHSPRDATPPRWPADVPLIVRQQLLLALTSAVAACERSAGPLRAQGRQRRAL